MPFRPDPFLQRFDGVRRLRRRPLIGCGLAVAAVALASGLRLAGGDLLRVAPFTTFYVAIAGATLVGGARIGALSIALSALASNYFFLEPTFAFSATPGALFATILFVVVSSALVGIVWLLNEAVDRLWLQAETTRYVLEAEPAGLVAVDDKGEIELVNAAVERHLGYGRDELLGRSVDILVPDGLRGAHAAYRASFADQPESRPMGAGRDLHAQRKDGSLLPVEIGLNPVQRNGRSGALATIVDITERKSLERRAEVLSNEVRHRARNLITVIQAVAVRKLPPEERAAFVELLTALARTQDLFAATTVAPLRSIVEGELAGFHEQASVSGCELLLTAEVARDFTLIVHELATNALKHGALASDAGRVMVTGNVADDGAFTFTWEERGGPPVRAPARKGFGDTILNEVPRGFSGTAEIRYDTEGVSYWLAVDVARISAVVALPTDAELA
jgi:PAS domain S-box-containing protein